MTPAELFGQGISLMFSGMGFVLFFLFILVWAIGLMSKLVNRYFPEPVASPKTSQTSPALSTSDDLDRLRPVIVAAIAHHRRSQGLN